ncbi:hypothetical protein EIP91_009374 [Steccherinum ochraceum]|uniref:AB hydrolase-1 domain-containing protein n=1 Tax=Steccherinum ochraceum TaxID=92696 RepID=A0A4R0R4E4_9APHY|nr:hypothetical protein EIP91_009374 [Steccherinum ochraceum]
MALSSVPHSLYDHGQFYVHWGLAAYVLLESRRPVTRNPHHGPEIGLRKIDDVFTVSLSLRLSDSVLYPNGQVPSKLATTGFAVERKSSNGSSVTLLKILGVLGCAVVLVLRLGIWERSSSVEDAAEDSDEYYFNWTAVSPSEDLKWRACYDGLECARLQVPLDYSDHSAGNAAIALVRSPSTIPRDDEGYLGPILINPGGPGGSGVSIILSDGKQLRTVIGDAHDIIGFDPRGIGFTTPTLQTLQTKGEQGLFLKDFLVAINSSDTALGSIYASAQNLGHLGAARMGDVARYVNTPTVARDMLSITKAHGRDKLQYWGFSYGTILGATFAAMFPDHVGRLVIDGVMDAENYYAALWSTNLVDADATLFQIYQACVDAGPVLCRIYEKTTEGIHARVQNLLTRLRTEPVSFYNATSGVYAVVDYSLVKQAIFRTLYTPYTDGKTLTIALAELELGNAEPIFKLSDVKDAYKSITAPCDCSPSRSGPDAERMENVMAIACGDGEPVEGDVASLKEFYDEMAGESTFAEVWYLRVGCSGWKVRAKERFTASFETNTSFPLLLIGNTADPVTPLRAARKMSRGFKNSVLLTQNSGGHCTLAATSKCTARAIRAYFQNGTLPKEGTVCEIESSIFADELSVTGLEDPDWELMRASHELQQSYFIPRL